MKRRPVVTGPVAWAAVALLALSGCSSTSPGNGRQNPDAPIEIWIRQPPASDSEKTAQRLAEAFTKESGVPTKVVAIFDDFETKLQQQATQRNLPDIVINDTAGLGNMQQQGWLREVDRAAFPGADKLSDRAWKAAQASDSRYYGVPFSAQAFALLVRADWRARLGLPEPKTWQQLADLGKAFTERDPDGNGKKDTYGFDIPGTTQRGYMSWYFSSLLWANGGDFISASGPGKWRPAIDGDRAVEAATWLQSQFCANRSVIPGAVNLNTTSAHEVFEKGQAGIYLVGPYVLARFVGNVGSDKIEVFPVPNGPSGGPGTLAEGENVYLMAGSENQAGQQKFAEFATSVAGQTIGMNGDNNGAIVRLPVSRDVDMAAVRKDPRWQVFQSAYETAGVYTPSVPNWTPIRQTSADSLNAVMANCAADVRQALAKLADQLGAELSKQDALAS
ncbi:sugar ABC transporter substrate-binding protein [Micromonospora sp. NPDC049559]|uniref:ABC transporter substrate-binding protein n=1 Tax=Micromonospora sp. NPDC049559 TaxID=3155923 RepID=UPI00341D83E9